MPCCATVRTACWRDIGYFWQQVGDNRKPTPDPTSVRSDWFFVDSRIRLDRAALDAQALIQRTPNLVAGGGPKVVWIRQY
ncbi:hypothetical protein GCM10025794_24390 [Massilia kyonggiensis]